MPEGESHETITGRLIDDLQPFWEEMIPPLRCEHIKKLALGPKGWKGQAFTVPEAVLAEIITGDAFGADRIDYLLRDSLHAGVQYGKFDHYRLIDSLCILPSPDRGAEDNLEGAPPMLGIEEGGLHTAEAMILARHFMFIQLYCHPVRRIYDIHLKDFLKERLPNGTYPSSASEHMQLTDAEVTSWIREASRQKSSPGHQHALRIEQRRHFKQVYAPKPSDIDTNPEASDLVARALIGKFGEAHVRKDSYQKRPGILIFPVKMKNDEIQSSINISQEILGRIPSIWIEFVFVEPSCSQEAKTFIKRKSKEIIVPPSGEED